MNVISKKTIVEFYTKHHQARNSLEAWHAEARKAKWKSPQDIKNSYKSASFLRDNRVVFNIKGNDYRLVVHIDYKREIVRIKFVGTHKEYDDIDAEEISR
jgi:mRNA interferase HigB